MPWHQGLMYKQAIKTFKSQRMLETELIAGNTVVLGKTWSREGNIEGPTPRLTNSNLGINALSSVSTYFDQSKVEV